MMSEIKQIESIINPTETFLVADSLTGQVAAEVAKEFKIHCKSDWHYFN